MHSLLSKVITLFVFSALAILLVVNTPDAKASTANSVVISEVSIAGFSTTDEFVELYNPTSNDINLQGWRLQRKSQTGATVENLISSMSGVIKAHGYFLVAHQTGYMGLVSSDATYTSTSLASNNTVLLYSDAGVTLIDKLGYGTATDHEGTAAANPTVGEGLERKASSTSTLDSMVNGADILMGNGEDSNNNSTDFVKRVVSQPQRETQALLIGG